MALQFKKATKEQSKLRLSIAGPAGSGKTYTSLRLASEIGSKIAVIDTERGSAAKYSDKFDFDVIELDDFHPDNYIEAIHAAEKGGYDVLVIDSTTHEWNGKGGILYQLEAAQARQKTKNSYTAWKDVTPVHDAFINAILQCKCHVIASVRSKADYVQDKNEQTGRTEIRKVGMASIQREGMDYEYDIMMEMDVDHVGVITKTRCAALDGKTFRKPGTEMADILKEWLSSGASPAVKAAQSTESDDTDKALKSIYLEMGKTESQWDTLYANEIKGIDLDAKKKKLAAWQKAALDRKAKAEVKGDWAQIEERLDALTKAGVSKQEQDALINSITKGESLEDCDDETVKNVITTLNNALTEASNG